MHPSSSSAQQSYKINNGRAQRIQSNSNHSSNNHSNPPRIKHAISERLNNNSLKRKSSHDSAGSIGPSHSNITSDKELKNIIKRAKNDFMPEPKHLQRILTLISHCKTAAHELYNHLHSTNWKYFRRWMVNSDKSPLGQNFSEHKKLIFQIIEKLILIANSDYKKENLNSQQNLSNQNQSSQMSQVGGQRSSSVVKQGITSSQETKGVLSNITNTYQNKKDQLGSNKITTNNKFTKAQNQSKERNISGSTTVQDCCVSPTHAIQMFKKPEVVGLVHSKYLVECIAYFIRPFKNSNNIGQLVNEKKQIQSLIGTVIDIILEFKDREMYDTMSLWFIKSDIFQPLVKTIINLPIEVQEYKSVARIFELCACHTDGIAVLQRYLKNIIDMVELFLSPSNDLIQVKYPAATVLLDLTANENCIEKVANLIKEKDIFDMIISELEQALQRKVAKNAPNKIYLNRFRDLMIGIVLNLTCNVESEEITEYMVSKDVIRLLKEILVDSRHDWPTNGAALALLQYAHLALSNADMFLKLEDSKIYDTMIKFVNECKNKETKRHMYEAITLITMSRSKMESISKILTQHCYAACA